MTARVCRLLIGATLVTCLIGFAKCRVDDTLDDRAWPCTRSDQCGTKDGKALKCWENFCMPTCEPAPDPGEPHPEEHDFVCLGQGVKLSNCKPHADPDCAAGFECLRTDLAFDYGICVPFEVCSDDPECPGTERTKCASKLLEEKLADRVGGNAPSDGAGGNDDGSGVVGAADHLLCVATGCHFMHVPCPDGEGCLGEAYSLEGNDLPDVCVPLCDSNELCPPNYACATTGYSRGSSRLCIPGLPGVRCTRHTDCIVGACEDTGAGFSVCTLPCDSDDFCAELLNSGPSTFRCSGVPGAQKYCLNTTPFQGVECRNDADCPPETPGCFGYSPAGIEGGPSECRQACDADGGCEARAGLGHVCLAEGDGGCYPGNFATPCRDSSECLTPFSCLDVVPTGFEVQPSSKICSTPCPSDDDEGDAVCDAQLPGPIGSTYCTDGVCRVALRTGKPCQRDKQCISNRCTADECEGN